MSRKKQVNKSIREPLVIGKNYFNKNGDSRNIKNIISKKIWWESSNEEGVSENNIFYDWIEGNYDYEFKRRRRL